MSIVWREAGGFTNVGEDNDKIVYCHDDDNNTCIAYMSYAGLSVCTLYDTIDLEGEVDKADVYIYGDDFDVAFKCKGDVYTVESSVGLVCKNGEACNITASVEDYEDPESIDWLADAWTLLNE